MSQRTNEQMGGTGADSVTAKSESESLSPEEFAKKRRELVRIAASLFMADMSLSENMALRTRACRILNEIKDSQQREMAYGAAVDEHIRLESEYEKVTGEGDGSVNLSGEGGPQRIVVSRGNELENALGREPTKAEREAEAYMIDAVACGRSVRQTVAACAVFGGHISEEVKAVLKRNGQW